MGDFESFRRAVHDAYAHLYDRAYLREHALVGLLGGGSAERAHRLLIEAIEDLRPMRPAPPGAHESRRYHHLRRRYVEGATPEQIATESTISDRQARRDHAEALDQVARQLWRRLGQATRTSPGDAVEGLDAALSSLASADGGATDIVEALEGVVETAHRLADENGVAIEVDVADDVPAAATSRTLLRQLLLGLLSEAIVANPGARVRLDARPRDGHVDVSMSAHAAPSSLPDAHRHLARSQRIDIAEEVTAHGWSLRLRLPAPIVKTLLVVDDNPDLALLFRRYLAREPYHVVQARSAERALRLARELQPDIVVLDVLMPLADGWEVLQALRADPSTRDLRVVICSVLPDQALAHSLGVTELLAKPVTRSALRAIVAADGPPIAAHPARP